METIEKQKTILSDKEKKLMACEKARKTSEGLVKDLLEKVCVYFISMMSWKVLALLFSNVDSTEKYILSQSNWNFFSNWTVEARTRCCFKLQGNFFLDWLDSEAL